MNEDTDLKRMFQATREIDEAMTPEFAELAATLPVKPKATRSKEDPAPNVLPISIAVSACLVIGLLFLIYARPTESPQRSVSSQEQIAGLDQICDSLLARLDESDFGPEMAWPTETDSLIPFQTFSFHSRTSP